MCKDNPASRWIRLGLHSFHLLRPLAPLVARQWMWAHYASSPNTKRLLNPRPSLQTIAFESLIKVKFICELHKLFTFWWNSKSKKKIIERFSWKKEENMFKVPFKVCFVQLVYHQWIKLTKITKYIFDYLSLMRYISLSKKDTSIRNINWRYFSRLSKVLIPFDLIQVCSSWLPISIR